MREIVKHTPAISRELMGVIVDEVFDGAIEDTRVIEEIYAVIKRHEGTPDLLAAAKRFFILEIETCNCEICTAWKAELKAAIAKAEGRP